MASTRAKGQRFERAANRLAELVGVELNAIRSRDPDMQNVKRIEAIVEALEEKRRKRNQSKV